MNKTRITPFQLYAMMVLFILGTSSVLFLGQEAKQDAWLAVLFSTALGIINFIIIQGLLFRTNPELPFSKILEKTLGKLFGKLLSLLYVLYLLFLASLVLRDIYQMLQMYVLRGTPRPVILILVLGIIIYAAIKGIETMARSGEIYFFLTIFAYIAFIILLLFSDIIKFDALFPILEGGFKPIIKSSLTMIFAFPFGELITFLYIYPYVNKKKKVIKVGILAIISTSLILTLLTILSITTIGVYWSQNSPFPVIKMIRLINVGNFIQRLDSIAVLIFLTGSLAKLSLYCFASNTGLQDIFNTKKYIKFLIPTGLIVFFGSYIIGDNYTTYMHRGIKYVPYYLNLPFEILIPIFLLILIFIKRLFKLDKKENY